MSSGVGAVLYPRCDPVEKASWFQPWLGILLYLYSQRRGLTRAVTVRCGVGGVERESCAPQLRSRGSGGEGGGQTGLCSRLPAAACFLLSGELQLHDRALGREEAQWRRCVAFLYERGCRVAFGGRPSQQLSWREKMAPGMLLSSCYCRLMATRVGAGRR